MGLQTKRQTRRFPGKDKSQANGSGWRAGRRRRRRSLINCCTVPGNGLLREGIVFLGEWRLRLLLRRGNTKFYRAIWWNRSSCLEKKKTGRISEVSYLLEFPITVLWVLLFPGKLWFGVILERPQQWNPRMSPSALELKYSSLFPLFWLSCSLSNVEGDTTTVFPHSRTAKKK